MTRTLTALALAAASLTLGTAAQAHTPHPLTPAVADGLAPGALAPYLLTVMGERRIVRGDDRGEDDRRGRRGGRADRDDDDDDDRRGRRGHRADRDDDDDDDDDDRWGRRSRDDDDDDDDD